MKYGFTSILIFFTCTHICTQGFFAVTPEIKAAYEEIMELKLNDAQIRLNQIKAENPQNLLVYHIENYIDFFRIFILEEKELLEKLEKNKSFRLEQIRKGDKSSPYYKFSQAEILLQWCLTRSKFYDDVKIIDLTLLNDLHRAYRLLEANNKDHTGFTENKKSLALIHSLASHLPAVIRNLFRIKGSIQLGMSEMEDLLHKAEQEDFLFSDEVYVIYSYMLMHLQNQPEQAWENLQKMDLDPSESPIAVFLFSTFALKTGRNDLAIEILENRPRDTGQLPFYYLDFLEGKARLHRLDPSSDKYIHSFLDKFQGRHFIKEAYQKLAWYELVINENTNGYKAHMRSCHELGNDLVEDDQQAVQEARKGEIPDIHLMTSRLLFDGGYYNKAEAILLSRRDIFQTDTGMMVEYFYRLGRINQEQGQIPEAIHYFSDVLKRDTSNDSFFAANSCLQIGQLMEQTSRLHDALSYFKKCLDFKPTSYKDQIQNKAKAGISRVEILLGM